MRKLTTREKKMFHLLAVARWDEVERMLYEAKVFGYLLERGKVDRVGARKHLMESFGERFKEERFQHTLGFAEFLMEHAKYEDFLKKDEEGGG